MQQETSHLAVSPDGALLAFVSPDQTSGAYMLGIERIGSTEMTILPGTEGASYPFWSPDITHVAFFADGKLKKIAVSGGVSEVLASAADGRGGTWNSNGVIVFAPQSSGWLWKVNADGSGLTSLTDKIFNGATEASHRWPLFLPDGNHFLFLTASFNNAVNEDGIYLSSLTGKEKSLLVLAHSNPGYANGYLFYLDDKRELRTVSYESFQTKHFRRAANHCQSGCLSALYLLGSLLRGGEWNCSVQPDRGSGPFCLDLV